MFEKFFRHRKYKKIIKASSQVILDDIAEIAGETISHFEGLKKMEPLKKEVLKFESTAFLFWLFLRSDIFPDTGHKLILDEIHNQYYEELRKRGYDSNLRQVVAENFNLRYRTYNSAIGNENDYARVGIKFIEFLSEKSKTSKNTEDLMIPIFLMEKITPKFQEYRKVLTQ